MALKLKYAGVTLIELSIIIAALGGFVSIGMIGKSILNSSRATGAVQQISDRARAFRVFTSSYECLPGDCSDADTKVQSLREMNGNGDGAINVYGGVIKRNEVAFVEEHYVKSRLFTKVLNYDDIIYTNIDLSKLIGKSTVPQAYNSNISSGGIFYNIVGGFSSTNSETADLLNFSPVDANVLKIVDSKADDGIADTGSIKCYVAKYNISADAITLPNPAVDYTQNCVLASVIEFK